MSRFLKFCLLICTVTGGNAFAQDASISGLVYSDYYWVAANHNEDLEGRNGFWFRRIYLTYEQGLSTQISMRLRLEMNSPGNFTSSSNVEPFAKDAYLRWKKGNHNIYIGLSQSPTWGYLESVWGYRSVEKTVLDLQRLASSRDVGFAVKGKLGRDALLNYHFMIGNGNGNGTETNQNKKIMLALGYELSKNFFVEGYADWDDRPEDTDRWTYQGFLSYKTAKARAGIQFVQQNQQQGTGSDLGLTILSLFTIFDVANKTKGIVRLDRMFDPNPAGEGISYLPFSSDAKSTFVLLGVDYTLAPSTHFIPNVELVFYDGAPGSGPNTDVVPRLTFAYNWNMPLGN